MPLRIRGEMGSHASEIDVVHGVTEESETTIEINIKTLDSQTHALRVNKCVPVPLLKEKIADVTGIISEQQRLICRGKVLKDDQLLSAYHVEDGHTLHLVVRQPDQSTSAGITGHEEMNKRRRGETFLQFLKTSATSLSHGPALDQHGLCGLELFVWEWEASGNKYPVWLPGVDNLEDGEDLVFDPAAYDCLHAFSIGWPCLSFDVLTDESLGLITSEFPHTVYCVAGTQAGRSFSNYIGIFKVSNITGKKCALLPDVDMEDASSSSDEDEDEDDEEDSDDICNSRKIILQLRKVAHHGCVNWIRAMRQNPSICATWSDSGSVQVWDLTAFLIPYHHQAELTVEKTSR